MTHLTHSNYQGVIVPFSPFTLHNINNYVTNVIESSKSLLFYLLDQLSDIRVILTQT